MKWILWGLLLAATNGASTLTSRARNTPSYGYHGVAACVNHAIWFCTNVMFVGIAIDIGALHDWHKAVGAFVFYTTCSTIGSVSIHWISINYFETGNRRVGAYEEKR